MYSMSATSIIKINNSIHTRTDVQSIRLMCMVAVTLDYHQPGIPMATASEPPLLSSLTCSSLAS